MERYTRQMILPEIGEAGQKRLNAASVLIVGLGGLGSPASLYLTGAGVGRIGLCDPDTVSVSNLQRQTLYTVSDVSHRKTDAAYNRLSALSPHTTFEQWHDGLTERNAEKIIAGYDIVVDCCDNHATRYLIDDICGRLGIPWVYGSIGAFDGRVSIFMPGGLRYSDLYPERKTLSSLPPSSGGVIGPLPGIIGAIEASETIKTICGFGETLAGRLLAINIKDLSINILEL